MSNAANERTARPYSPWSEFDPPADLQDDLKAIYRLAAGPIMIAESFCSLPERFGLSPQEFSAWFDPLKKTRNDLAGWLTDHEAELRAEAPEVLLALQRILGVVQPLWMRLGALIGRLDARADPDDAEDDAELVALVNAVRENSARNHLQLAHASLDGISVSEDSLTELRSALSLWANRRELAGDIEAEDGRLAQEKTPELTESEKAVLLVIQGQPKGKGISCKEIIAKLKRKKVALVESTLRRHILRKLKKHFGVVNHRSAGGYLIP
jgi:hypothetical protein